MTQKLMMRGISRELIQRALEEEFVADERAQIKELLRKRRFDPENADEATRRKTAQFLMRKGIKWNLVQYVVFFGNLRSILCILNSNILDMPIKIE